jgi:hypothetical protein
MAVKLKKEKLPFKITEKEGEEADIVKNEATLL